MLRIYRSLLRLYPASHREQFGAEMIQVFSDRQAESHNKGLVSRGVFFVREAAGLARGALQEHVRLSGPDGWLQFSMRRFAMHDRYRFPKSTPILMTLILLGVVLAIEKGEAISSSLPHTNPPIGPIQPEHWTFLPSIALFFAFFYAAGLIGWAILFALRRSGMHRLADMSPEHK